jgi:SAM-dependent methyltransferase
MSDLQTGILHDAAAAFDSVALSYDDLFTRTTIGRAQRGQVWQRLLAAFQPGERILELNCGTGEDARFLGQRGVRVVACDVSSAMIEVAKGRSVMERGSANIEYRQLANEDLHALSEEAAFDGAFSNFSGLNCMKDLQPLARNLASLVRPGGHVLICIWSRICMNELVWFLVHGQPSKALRRYAGHARARIGNEIIDVSYPTVRGVRRSFLPWFRLKSRSAIGLFVPPSYVEKWAVGHGKTLAQLERLDSMLAELPLFRDLGDHVLLEFVRCRQ